MAQEAPSKGTIVLIHGLWLTPLAWEDWIARYTKAGYKVIAPGWPGIDDRTVEDIRKNPSPLEKLTIGAVVDKYAGIIEALPSPPIIIGHSFGGLFTQILLNRGLGSAGVGISPAQPGGVNSLEFSTVKAAFGILGNPFTYNAAVPFTADQFHYNFGNHLSKEESKKLYDKHAIPGAAHVLWQGAIGDPWHPGQAQVDFGKVDRAPMLMIAGSKDHVVPEGTVKAEFKKYHGPARVELKVLEGKTHGICNQEGWGEVADLALKWAEDNKANK